MRLSAMGLAGSLATLVGTAPLAAAGERPSPTPPAVVLDVPYVGQTEALCGGAAVAMIFRYWGRTGVYPEDFAPLVDQDGAGIRTGVLVAEVRRRGWRAIAFAGTESAVQRHLRDGRPVLVLLEDQPRRYHYVVLTGWVGDRVLLHDPAVAPFRWMEEERFHRAWAATDYWSLLILPGVEEREEGPGAGENAPSGTAPPATGNCEPVVEEAVRMARGGEIAPAQSLLEASADLCPQSPGPLRELAGIKLLQERWAEAERLAEQSVRIDPGDEQGWRLLGTSRFLQGDSQGALRAFNEAGEPRVDLTEVQGLERTQQKVVQELLDLEPRSLLTDEALRRARRRLELLPAALSSRIRFLPQGDGSAVVEAAVQERPLFFHDRFDVIALGLHALSEGELPLRLSSPMHAGELWSLDWRFREGRPRVGLSLSVPRSTGPGSLWRIDGSWEEESYSVGSAGSEGVPGILRERRARAALSFQDWTAFDLLWEVGGGIDRFRDQGTYLSLGGALEKRSGSDRVGLRVAGSISASLEGGPPIAAGGLGVRWRSSAESSRTVWKARAGFDAVTDEAPRMLWPGAGLGHARSVLLRAHPLLEDGVVEGEVFGRELAHGGLECERWLPVGRPARIAAAAFADLARSARGARATAGADAAPWQLDVGAGVRIALPGQNSVLRIDAARGLVDGSFALSMGWQRSWLDWN
jgi:hypothetical protein